MYLRPIGPLITYIKRNVVILAVRPNIHNLDYLKEMYYGGFDKEFFILCRGEVSEKHIKYVEEYNKENGTNFVYMRLIKYKEELEWK